MYVSLVDTNTNAPSELSSWRPVDEADLSIATLNAADSLIRFGINNTAGSGISIPSATETVAGVMAGADKVHLDDLPETYIATKEYSTLDQVSLDGDIYTYYRVTSTTGNSPTAANSTFWNKLGEIDLVSTTAAGSNNVVITNTGGMDATITPADSGNPGVMIAADKVNLDALPNEWVLGATYTIGQQVTDLNLLYTVLVGHTSTNNPRVRTAEYALLGSDTETNLTLTNRGTDSLRIDSDQGTDAVVPAATRALAGLLTSTDKRKVDTIPTEWSSTATYGGESLVSLNNIIYVSLTGNTDKQPATQGVIYTLADGAVVTAGENVNIVARVDGVSTTLSTFTTISTTTVETLVDGLVANFSSSEYTIAENSAGTGVSVTKNDRTPFTLLSDALNTGFSLGSFNATAEFWQEELDYIKTRGINVLTTDPTNPFDGQVWYNSDEDFIKYFTAIDSTSQEECLSHGGTFTSGACSIDGVTEIVNHTANNFETTSTAVADTGSRSRIIINGTGVTQSVTITFVDEDGNTVNPLRK